MHRPLESGLVDISGVPFDHWEKRIPSRCLVERDAWLCDLARDRRVLHLGAADAPFHRQQAPIGALLHQRLRAVAASVIGIDRDLGAVDWLRRYAGIEDILALDLYSTALPNDLGPFEVVLCCDLIEHLSDPGRMLDRMREFIAPKGLLVITTANATALKQTLRALQGRETVHPEHCCYFSFSTLAQLLIRHGFAPQGLAVFNYRARSVLLQRLFAALACRRAGVADGLLMTARHCD